jgi:hypothetical protein
MEEYFCVLQNRHSHQVIKHSINSQVIDYQEFDTMLQIRIRILLVCVRLLPGKLRNIGFTLSHMHFNAKHKRQLKTTYHATKTNFRVCYLTGYTLKTHRPATWNRNHH